MSNRADCLAQLLMKVGQKNRCADNSLARFGPSLLSCISKNIPKTDKTAILNAFRQSIF